MSSPTKGVIGEVLSVTSNRLGKDVGSTYEQYFGGKSLSRDRFQQGLAASGLEKGGLVRGYGIAIKGKKKIRVL